MLRFAFERGREAEYHLLLLGAHSDDIEIGCGGTVLRLAREYPRLRATWVVFGAQGDREREARDSAGRFLQGVASPDVRVKSFRDGFFPYSGGEIKECFEELKGEITPDLILTHCRHDAHQDHRLLCELTWNTWRDHAILEYEVPKYDGDLGQPNLFVELDRATAERKVAHLMQGFATQRDRHWFTESTFLGLMRLRGVEARSRGGYAEAFYSRKCVL